MEKESPDGEGLTNRLGENSFAKVEENIFVINMIAQYGIYGGWGERPLKYNSLVKCMEDVVFFVEEIQSTAKDKTIRIIAPKFCSELAGGEWEFIEELIKDIWIDRNIPVTIYEF